MNRVSIVAHLQMDMLTAIVADRTVGSYGYATLGRTRMI
jgi:hypothetical protein